MIYKLRISPDGSEVFGLYSDKLPWRRLGELAISRATDVRFNDEIQRWEIYVIAENRVLPDTFLTREQAVQAEVTYLQGTMFGCP